MNVYIPLGLLLIFLCLFSRNSAKASVNTFLFSMLVLAVFGAVRYSMGNDYTGYLTDFQNVKDYGYAGFYYNIATKREPGFVLLLSVFPSYFLFIIFLTILWHALVSYLCVKYVPHKYLWLSLFLLLFDQRYIIQNYVALRSSVVCCLFIVAILLVINKKRIWAIVVILLSATVHVSAIGLLPFAFFDFWLKLEKKINWIILVPVFCFLLLFHQVITDYMATSVVEYLLPMDRYEGYIKDYNQKGFTIGAILDTIVCLIPPFLMIKPLKQETDPKYKYLIFISILVSLTSTFVGSMMIRYYMYFGPFILIALFRSALYLKDSRYLMFASLIVVNVYNFYQLQFSSWFSSFLQYKTIFEAPTWM